MQKKKVALPKPALRRYRAENQLTAQAVAKRLDIAPSTLRSFENGSRELSGEMAVRIEKRLGINREKLRADLFVR